MNMGSGEKGEDGWGGKMNVGSREKVEDGWGGKMRLGGRGVGLALS